MKKYIKKDRIETIRNNPNNRRFFEAVGFFGDKGYSILNTPSNGELFVVSHKGGVAYYKLIGSKIGSYTSFQEN